MCYKKKQEKGAVSNENCAYASIEGLEEYIKTNKNVWLQLPESAMET